MNFNKKPDSKRKRLFVPFYKKGGLYVLCILLLFVLIGALTSIAPAYQFSSKTLSEWTSKVESTTFLYLLGMENRAFQEAFPEGQSFPKLSNTLFQLTTSIKPNDVRSLLGRELPGFSAFNNKIVVAGEGTNYTNLPIESSPPLKQILKDREAEVKEPEQEGKGDKKKKPAKVEENVVFLYNTHNRESFLPLLPKVDDPDLAYHDEANITKVSDRLAQSLEDNGIGAIVDHTDITKILQQKGMKSYQSYDVSRNVVEEAFASHEKLNYVFDIHRDSQPREVTTTTIGGEKYARIAIVVGGENADFQKNLAFAQKLNSLMEEKYPGLNRAVIVKEGPGVDGVYNQDLSKKSLIFEIGGVGNNLEELYRSADALAEVFSDFYYDAEKVSTKEKED
ncbi:stage II sporulation protein P [Virgibacillus phasianinus]|uniref:Stage II sporulation protein P n=1 Tax=Virgibacillus phasianinus TaxID=2017483 RepID=A0A220U4U8_9BACI|nr:stage II sporulation protein P [Virgibacillus phasianinus]ASK63139.1 stage II sporulation protein P [Virgibacillus phasianinus]